MTILALHGFLGTGKDFEPLINRVSSRGLSAEWLCPNIFKPGSKFNLGSLSELAVQLNSEFEAVKGPKVLLGYSMGGRLALEMFKRAPEKWHRIILFSTHLGLQSSDEQRDRLKADEAWAHRFINEPWMDVISSWDAQEVFQGDPDPSSPSEADFDRERLGLALLNLSLSRQSLSKGLDLKTFQNQISFVVGQRDLKFKSLYKQWKNQGIILDYLEVTGSGHRLLKSESPELLTYLVDRLKL